MVPTKELGFKGVVSDGRTKVVPGCWDCSTTRPASPENLLGPVVGVSAPRVHCAKMPEGALTTVLTTEAALALALVAPWRDIRGVLPAMDAEDLW